MAKSVAEFREVYRRERIRPGYRGWLHIGFTTFGALAAIVYTFLQIEQPRGWEWAVPPATFLFANFVEYRVHRGPMHHRGKLLSILFERHTLEHHRFYTHQDMEFESSRDFAATLFPPVMLLFFLGGIATPVGALLYVAVGHNVGWLFACTAVCYFLNYELLHFAYHVPRSSWVHRLPFMGTLRRLHTTHHDPRLMTTKNFNITYPIFDLLYGSYEVGEE